MDDNLELTHEILELNAYIAESNVKNLCKLHKELEDTTEDFIQQMEELLYQIL